MNHKPDIHKKLRWHIAYYVLAVFNILTIAFTLLLSHQIMGIYQESVIVHKMWANRSARFLELGSLAGKMNAPGNNIFDSHDFAGERERLKDANAVFDLYLTDTISEITQGLRIPVESDHPFRLNPITCSDSK